MRNPERSALLKVSGLLGSTVVAMGLGLSSACAQKNPTVEYNQPAAPLQTKAPFSGAGPAASVPAGAPNEAQPGQSFEQWRDAFRQQALAGGIDAQTFDRAFAGVQPDPAVVEADRSQPEFTRPVWKYLEGALDPLRVRQGQARLAQHARILGEVDARYAVDADAVVAIWGMESNYGSHMGNKNVIRSLATLAYEGRRPEFAHAQLLAALKILQHGDVPASFMIGSWAGAMGQTQFIPTTYNQYAVDFDGALLGAVAVSGATNLDWEDMGVAACGAGTCLYLADVGDNAENRDEIVVFRVPEPAPADPETADADAFRMVYPDHPRDAEAIFVLPGEALFVVTKGRSEPAELYRYPGALRSDAVVTLERVQSITEKPPSASDMITGAAASLDGRTVAIRTYTDLHLYRVQGSGLEDSPSVTQALGTLGEPQGEAVALGADGLVVLTSEAARGAQAGLSRIRCELPG